MARPNKNNADYFIHDNDMRKHTTIMSLRAKYGAEGYACYCYLLEMLTEADGLALRWSELDIELYKGDFFEIKNSIADMVNHMVKIGLFQLEDSTLRCAKLSERLQPIFDKRTSEKERQRQKRKNKSTDFI